MPAMMLPLRELEEAPGGAGRVLVVGEPVPAAVVADAEGSVLEEVADGVTAAEASAEVDAGATAGDGVDEAIEDALEDAAAGDEGVATVRLGALGTASVVGDGSGAEEAGGVDIEVPAAGGVVESAAALEELGMGKPKKPPEEGSIDGCPRMSAPVDEGAIWRGATGKFGASACVPFWRGCTASRGTRWVQSTTGLRGCERAGDEAALAEVTRPSARSETRAGLLQQEEKAVSWPRGEAAEGRARGMADPATGMPGRGERQSQITLSKPREAASSAGWIQGPSRADGSAAPREPQAQQHAR